MTTYNNYTTQTNDGFLKTVFISKLQTKLIVSIFILKDTVSAFLLNKIKIEAGMSESVAWSESTTGAFGVYLINLKLDNLNFQASKANSKI